ncbi:BPSS1780 family membrane protein [Pseudoalteromonas umbrosa]|uniref:BPSS1780 family membrane protein n=1 Tax=Pseudoalteromonas umbrosa TaxID=3048489 RepID=UPI0024C3913B|nr:BPSS1780 family membrane protein [Pseudoalteromonas sp. B95]MDK1287160.1 BPSS1780 family membrane protein [Pseudoalteromonas sp. B95]
MSADFQKFKASFGVSWFKAGWAVFKTQPLTFMMMYIFIVIVGLFPFVIPNPIIQMMCALAGPFLTVGFYNAALNIQAGKSIMLADILKPFTTKGRRLNLFRLGLYQLGVALILGVLMSLLFEPVTSALQNHTPDQDMQIVIEQIAQAISFSDIAIFIALQSLAMMAFAYALPLVYFKEQANIFAAMKESLSVFYHNMAPLTVYGGIAALLIILSTPLSLVPLIFIMPILYIGFFVSFQAIFATQSSQSEDGPSQGNKSQDDKDSVTQSGRFDA